MRLKSCDSLHRYPRHKKIVVFGFFSTYYQKIKHTYLQFTTIIPSPQPNLNIIHNLNYE